MIFYLDQNWDWPRECDRDRDYKRDREYYCHFRSYRDNYPVMAALIIPLRKTMIGKWSIGESIRAGAVVILVIGTNDFSLFQHGV